ncbi:MAG: Nif3-like dinuclear metal center hexameric protein [Rikenellaceae bacterium]
MMKIKDIVNELEQFAPLSLQEQWDNCGVQVGDVSQELKGIVLCLDITQETVSKAIENGFNMIISHHPLIFSGIKSLTGKNTTEKIVLSAIKNDLVIYSGHTNFDKAYGGVSFAVAKKIGLKNLSILVPSDEKLKKIALFTPKSHYEIVQNAAFSAGAGKIGNYECCGFTSEGRGSFRALEGANPYVGEINEIHFEDEVKFETIVTNDKLYNVLNAIKAVHPYEEVAYDIFNLEINRNDYGLGVVGDIEETNFDEFAEHIKNCLDIPYVRHSKKIEKNIQRVAICGGSGASFVKNAMYSNADIYLSGDFKYHDFQVPNDSIMVMDIGHFESEKFIIEIFYSIVTKKISNFADCILVDSGNPVNYI